MGEAQRAVPDLPTPASGPRVGSVSGAIATADRLVIAEPLPLGDDLAGLIGAPGLARGQWVMCSGSGALSLGVAMGAAAVAGGAWMAILGLPPLGVDALRELGVDPGRVLAVAADPQRSREWAERLVVCAEGCEVILTAVPAGVSDSLWRSLSARVRRHGAVVIAVPATPPIDLPIAPVGGGLPVDLRCRVLEDQWEGLGCGRGRLAARRLHVEVLGRRRPGATRAWVRVPAGDVAARDVSNRENRENGENVENGENGDAAH